MYKRSIYLKRIKPFINKPVIKIITGMRRTGKSCFMRLIADYLTDGGVESDQIVFIHMDLMDYSHLDTAKNLHEYIKDQSEKQRKAGKKTYLFVDEIQEVKEWERCVESLYASEDYDIYISGSNAHLLSSDLATYISGRYVEFPVYTLGFKEYQQFMQREEADKEDTFRNFIRLGGLPALYHFDQDVDVIYQYISSLYNTILLKDVVKRNKLRNIALLENITQYVFSNIGNIFSAKKVADYLKSQRINVGFETVQNYLSYICETFALYKVPRYDVKGKRILEVHEKYYLGDIGMRHAVIGYREDDIGGILENVVFLELKRRGYSVNIGKVADLEIDFIATKAEEKIYIQVAYLLATKETREREYRPLLLINDNYPKFVLSMDALLGSDYQGIRILNIIDFLLGKY